MIKKLRLSTEGMVRDITKSKFPGQMYFDAKNIRIIATDQQSTYSVTNEHGNEKEFIIPTPSIDLINKRILYSGIDNILRYVEYKSTNPVPGNEIEEEYTELVSGNYVPRTSGLQKIIGKAYTRDNVIILTTDDNGFDCIWEIENISTNESLVVKLLYMRNMGFSVNNPIQAIYNYENTIIEKLYWVDGNHQLRFINIRQSILNGDSEDLIDMNVSSVDTVGTFDVSQPQLISLTSGGSHTAGMIQYAYNLYRINGSQTAISPLSEMITLGKDSGGGDVNEVVSVVPTISIKDIDVNYSNIKIYSVKYTSYNQTPTINIVFDGLVSNYSDMRITDSGVVNQTLSLAEFLFLGSNVFIPKHIETKNLRMFLFNIKEIKFDVKDLDTRIYGHSVSGEALVWENLISDGSGGVTTNDPIITLNTTTYALDKNHDSINRDYNIYKFQKNGTTFGAEGKYIKIEIDRTQQNELEYDGKKLLKDREIYRFGIEFFNTRGQVSFPYWMCDLKAPEGNLQGFTNKVKLTLKPEFYTWLSTQSEETKPIGYRLIRSERTESDKTIVCQGIINSMAANIKKATKTTDKTVLANESNSFGVLKIPSLQRPLMQYQWPFVGATDYHDLSSNSYSTMNAGHSGDREGFSAAPTSQYRAQNIQFNKMMQIFSPEVTFGNSSFNSSNTLRVVGTQLESEKNNWGAEYNPISKQNEVEGKFLNGFQATPPSVIKIPIIGDINGLYDYSFYGPTNASTTTSVSQLYRKFKGGFLKTPVTGISMFNIYGTPEKTNIGQDSKPYNNDSSFRYANSLRPMLLDNWDESASHKNTQIQIQGCNSYGGKCVTIMEGDNSSLTPIANRRSLEKIFTDARLNTLTGGSGILLGNVNSAMLVEICQDSTYEYLGGIYGGNTMESKSKSSYISVGPYSEIGINNIYIDSPGDTFISDFNFEKISKTDTELSGREYTQLTELISIPVETTINLRERNDISINPWDNRFQPRVDEYHKYNQVYSQEPTLIKTTGKGFKFKDVEDFDAKIIASSQKIPGEFIDSWTNYLENETRDLDGRYGPINGTAKINDEIYTFQDSGIAKISIEPRVQTQALDGLALQIGTGSVLNYHYYISTESGTKNKWSILQTSKGIYYYDTINRSIGNIGEGMSNVSDANGFHSFMNQSTNIDELSIDNPLIGKGVSVGYNNIENEVLMTFLQDGNNFTIGITDSNLRFTSFYDYTPSMYIGKAQRLITSSSNLNEGWQHFKGLRNRFYGIYYPSYITFLPNPGNESDVVFNNAEYKMEMTDVNGNDLPNKTFSKIRLWNEYQDTGNVDLTIRSNVSRKFRNWNITFPRVSKGSYNSRDRIRNPWTYIKFTFDNLDGKKMVAHDIIISYTEY